MVNLRRNKSGLPVDDSMIAGTPLAPKPAASVSRVVTLTVVDQGASSISNFGLSVLVAHGSSARELGIFTIIITTYILCQGLVRSVTSDCLLTRSWAVEELRVRFERSGYLFALVSATGLSLVVLAIAVVVGSSFAVPLLIFAICFPLMALQDFSRYIGIGRHDPAYAIRLDVAWIVLFVVGTIAFRSAHMVSLPWLFGAWSGAGALVGLWTLPAFLSVRRGLHELRFWVRSEWSVGTRFAGQFLVGTSGANVVFYLLVLVLSIDVIGLIKITQLALGPIVVLFAGVQSALVSIVSKKMREDRHQATRFLQFGAVIMTLTMAVCTVVVYVVPAHLVADVFGPTWLQARPFMLWIGLSTALRSVSAAALIGLRAIRAAKELLRLVVIMAPFLLVFPLGGAMLGGVRGFAVGSGVFYVIYLFVGWVTLARAAKRFEVDDGEGPEPLRDVLAREGLVEPISLGDMLAREHGVEPVSLDDMLSHHGAVDPVSLAGMLARQDGPDPVTLDDMAAREVTPER